MNIASPECLTNADNDSDRECETSMPAYGIFAISTANPYPPLNVLSALMVASRELEILCDTGAELNVLSSHYMPDLSLEKAHVSISAWGNFQLPVLGSARCFVSCEGRTVDDTFYIIESTSSRTLPLFTYDLCRKLGIIAELASIGESVVDVHCILDNHRAVFEQKGLLNTEYAYDIHIVEGATPISVPARRLPPTKVLPLLRQELQRMTVSSAPFSNQQIGVLRW